MTTTTTRWSCTTSKALTVTLLLFLLLVCSLMMTTTTTTTTTAVDIPGGLRRRTLITRTGRRREEEEEEEAGTDQQDIFLQNHVLEPIRTLLSSSASAATSVGQQQPQPQSRIIGGSDASAGEFPFVAEFELGCGGSLIAPSVILSVAHCHDIIVNGKFAYVGSNKLRNGFNFSSSPRSTNRWILFLVLRR